ncbi:MAG: hypothetical protein ACI4DP_01930 [Candidatus Ornithomonoglobus sp.]
MTDSEMKTSAYDMLYLSACAIDGISPDRERIQQMNDDDLYAVCRFHSLTAVAACALESAGIVLSKRGGRKGKSEPDYFLWLTAFYRQL